MSSSIARVLAGLLFVSVCANFHFANRKTIEPERTKQLERFADNQTLTIEATQSTNDSLQNKINLLEQDSEKTITDYNALVDKYDALAKQYANLQLQNNLIGPPSTKDEIAVEPPRPPPDVVNTPTNTQKIKSAVVPTPSREDNAVADGALKHYSNGNMRTPGMSLGGDSVGPRGGVYHYSPSGKKVYRKK